MTLLRSNSDSRSSTGKVLALHRPSNRRGYLGRRIDLDRAQ